MKTNIAHNIRGIKDSIRKIAESCGRNPDTIALVAVSKRFPPAAILEGLEAGQQLFGENYIQEAKEKFDLLGDRVKLHFIGHLQTNKAKTAAEIATMVETVDRFKIAEALDKHCAALNRILDILIQVNIGLDDAKSGILPEQTEQLLRDIKTLANLQVKGLMTIPPFSDTPEDARAHFRALRELAESLGNKGLLPTLEQGCQLSMGMSGDYHIAIEEGATLVRVGTAIFGERI